MDFSSCGMEAVFERAKRIRYLLLDVDGVLTNGVILMSEGGEETVGFSIYDGLGLSLWRQAGYGIGFISGRSSMAVARRAADMGVEECHLGVFNKMDAYSEIVIKHELKDEEVAYVGDDVIDLPLLRRVGLAVSVPNAVESVRKVAHWITQKRGGEGAVRELIDAILLAQGKSLLL
jgi:3-deoxy-D-manno-octulosonate 8-phosphate phosphatase (KDO 8-P phosphatase)